MQIDPRMRGKMPKVDAPVTFMSKDGRIKGWKATIPGHRTLATPAIADGLVFLGGGFGSYEFYAFDADAGTIAWQYQTNDDGPTAAVADGDCLAFATESCELEVLTLHGRPIWKKWLGDPLMSMPAMDGDRLFAIFPDSRGDHQHYLAAFGLHDGHEFWRKPIDAEVITAPVLADGFVYLTNIAGTMFCFRQDNGEPVWRLQNDATSSPAVWKGECFFSQKREAAKDAPGQEQGSQMEHVAARGTGPEGLTRVFSGTGGFAPYLDHAKRARRSPRYAAYTAADAHVGWGAYKGDAKIHMAMKHLGQGHVFGVWAYQGSKPFIDRGRLYSCLGDTAHCVDPLTQHVFWKKRLRPEQDRDEMLDSVLTPPAIVNGKLFVGSLLGDLYCLAADSGEVLWSVSLGEAIVFQPAVARGRVYTSTERGSLYCLETGDPRDDGWAMWGGSAAHNGPKNQRL